VSEIGMADQSLRGYIERLRRLGEIVEIAKPVDPERDMSALAWKAYAEHGKASMFSHVKGHVGWRVVSQIVPDRRKWGIALSVDENEVVPATLRRMGRRLPTVEVAEAPCQERVLTGEAVDLTALPAMWTSELDPGRYIASGMCVIRNPETGIRNVSYHRAQILGRNRTGFLMLPRQAGTIAGLYRELGRPMEVAMVVGTHPLIGFAGALVAPFGLDEMTIAGGLLDEPVRMVKCRTVDLEVPAESEIVLEGIVSDETTAEGPFGEVTGTYGYGGDARVFTVTAVTSRKDPIFYAMHCGLPPSDTHSIVNLTIEMKIWEHLQAVDGGQLDLLDVRALGGVSPLVVVLQLRSRWPGQARTALLAALTSPYLHPKFAIAVDEDIDPSDLDQVVWALATRVQAAGDVQRFDATRVFALDAASPSEPGVSGGSRIGTKMIIDATRPVVGDFRFARALPPSLGALRLNDLLDAVPGGAES
jgi:UbiD family decarboxylase